MTIYLKIINSFFLTLTKKKHIFINGYGLISATWQHLININEEQNFGNIRLEERLVIYTDHAVGNYHYFISNKTKLFL